MADPDPISWRSIVYGTVVAAADGEAVGTVREVLGSDADDIFHGLRVRLTGGGRDVRVEADDISDLGPDRIETELTRQEIDALPQYDEEATYHLASVGWLRKHLGWRQDSTGDEEAG